MRFTLIIFILLAVVIVFFYFVMLPLIQDKVLPNGTDNDTIKPNDEPIKPETQPNESNSSNNKPDNVVEKVNIPEPGPDIKAEERILTETWHNIKDDSEMMYIQAGTFIRGSNEKRNHDVEHPVQNIYVSSFYIDKYQITNKQYRKFMDNGGYEKNDYWSEEGWKYKEANNWTKPLYWDNGNFAGENKPVVGISWFEAYAYCKWAGKRMVHEVEWEKAARGYNGQKYPWGKTWKDSACNWGDKDKNNSKMRGLKDGFDFTAPVDAYEENASPFGVVQMSGNTFEWVYDWWGGSFFQKIMKRNQNLLIDPVNLRFIETQKWRVLKGGAFDMPNYFAEPSYRYARFPYFRLDNVGFRCALNASKVLKIIKQSSTPDNNPEDE